MSGSLILDRRGAIRGGAKAAAAFSLAAPLSAIMEAQARAQTQGNGAQTAPVASPYGPLAPARDLTTGLFLLQLPQGFSYRSMSWEGDMMSDGQRVAARHDGMAVVQVQRAGRGYDTFLIRNHEVGGGRLLLNVPGGMYDTVTLPTGQRPAGGCTMLRVREGQLVEHRAVIGGTLVNCAGGRTLWNSWLTCEETLTNLESAGGKKHGYVFDVPMNPAETSPVPIVGMGRFAHEAIATDPVTGYIYETEDARNISAFYRFKPASSARRYGALEQGGTLQAARIVGRPRANLLALAGPRPSDVDQVGQTFDIEWVTINEPDANPSSYTETGADNPDIGARTASGPFVEARSKGALRMSRGEGIWWDHTSDCLYVVDTSFGYEANPGIVGQPVRAGRGLGAIWAYRPSRTDPERGTLTLLYAAAARVAGNNPDNITVSPRGGLLTCDDGSAVLDQFGRGNRMMGYRRDGLAYIFGKNNMMLSATDIARMGKTGQFNPGDYRGAEFCGAAFDWSGRTLYVNIQSPGVTFAITGPWGLGNLG